MSEPDLVDTCPNCDGPTLRPADDVFTEVERFVLEGTQLWACPCGHTEHRPVEDLR